MISQCGDGDAAIDLVGFEAQFPETDALREHIVTLKTTAGSVQETASETSVTWSSLQNPGTYSAPGQEIVYSAMVPVTTAAQGLLETVEEAAAALNTYADEAAEIKTRYRNGARIEAQQFLQEIAGDPEWKKERSLTDKQDRILDSLNGLTMELEASQRSCANALGRLWSGTTYGAADENGETASGHTPYGLTADAYEAAGEANLAWGNNAEWNYTAFKEGSIPHGMLMGFGDGIEETISFAGSLAFLRGIDKGTDAWGGIFDLALLGIYAIQPNSTGRAARDKLKDVGKAAIGLDMWETDPARAGGRNIFDIITILVPGGIIAKGIKIGDLAPGSHGKAPAVDRPGHGHGGRPSTVGPEYAGIPPGFFDNPKPQPWQSITPEPKDRGNNGDTGDTGAGGNSSGTNAPEYGIQLPDQRDPRPGYVGRDPSMQPAVGETGAGGGAWGLEHPQEKGGPYQEFITGVKGPDGKWLEYVVPVEKTELTPTGKVKFDGYFTEPGPPPAYVFQEAKDHYAFMANIPGGRLEKQLEYWFSSRHAQFASQASALENIPNARLEWNFSEESMRDAFLEAARDDPIASALLKEGKLVVNWVPVPGKEIG